MKNITIIGAGACGVAAFAELFLSLVTKGLKDKVKITWMEKDGKWGHGLAFGTDQPGHLLNTQADLMGLYVNEPSHYVDWLDNKGGKSLDRVKGKGGLEDSYSSRQLYGRYLFEHSKSLILEAKAAGLTVELLHQKADGLQREGDNYQLLSENGDVISSDIVILALGTPKPNNFKHLLTHSNYIPFPWPSGPILEKMNQAEHIGILGSSLSAIDAVMTLVDNKYEGKISLYSPDGLVPRVQPVKNKEVARNHLTMDAIYRIRRENRRGPLVKEIFRLFRKDVEEHTGEPLDWKELDREGKDVASLLQKDIALAEEGGDPLMNVAYSLRYDSTPIWSLLSIEEKLKFMKWLGPDWGINRHGMPLPNAKKLQKLFKGNKLRVVPFFEDVAFSGKLGEFQMKIKDKPTESVQLLINATGSPGKLDEMESTLLRNMLNKGYLSPYRAGGVCVNEQILQLLSPKGGSGIYGLGHILNGQLMDVNAVWFNVKCVSRMIKDITDRLLYGDFS
ncbi:FAD/NAD(P)-binding protein [Pleomorphovibrio marinus]|uniref:FAD/NAD(P)-binding protein n=1 Tax=Pleomorphovibrio marinus TaxID=2164132 RepID=UPI000E0CBA1B|nr:FAD/NAD(P)-binding protein [Pleomorphovibrio marinus]